MCTMAYRRQAPQSALRTTHQLSFTAGRLIGRAHPKESLRALPRVRGRLQALLRGKAERFGMGRPVVLGQRLAGGAGLVGYGPSADLAASDRKLGDGDRETA